MILLTRSAADSAGFRAPDDLSRFLWFLTNSFVEEDQVRCCYALNTQEQIWEVIYADRRPIRLDFGHLAISADSDDFWLIPSLKSTKHDVAK